MLAEFDIGKSGENFVKQLFNNFGFTCELNTVYAKRYENDLFVDMDGLKFTIECKKDMMSLKTGNLAIEINNCKSDKPSGIYSTKSDIWVHMLPNKQDVLAYAIPVKELILFAETVKPFKKTTASGDGNSDLLIYKKDIILNEFSRFDHISNKEEFKALFSELLS